LTNLRTGVESVAVCTIQLFLLYCASVNETENADSRAGQHAPTEPPGTVYFAAQRHGTNLLDADEVTRLAAVSRPHAVKLLASMARKGVLHRIGRGRYAVISPSVLHDRKSYVTDPHLVIDELMKAERVNSCGGVFKAWRVMFSGMQATWA
jgi:hypothetical protein